jgi:hypothetical protein
MKLNLGKTIQNLDYYMGLYFLKNPKFFSYTVFDKILEKKFSKEKKSTVVQNFLEKGFSKIDCDLTEDVKNIISQLSLHPDYRFFDKNNYFAITKEIYLVVQEIVNIRIKLYLDEISQLFGGSMYLAGVDIQRNTENSKMLDANFHLDYYLCNYFKIFINLSDVTLDCGPTEIIPKNYTSHYIDRFGYKTVDQPITKNFALDPPEYIYKNTGKKNEAILFHSSGALHRAGIPKPGFFRDLLRLTFVIDFHKKNINNEVFHYYENGTGEAMSKYIAKPNSFSHTLKIYKNYKKFSRIIN